MNNQDLIVMLLDESGSMELVRHDTVGSINSFIKSQRKVGDALFRLVKFSNPEKFVELFKNVKLSEASLTSVDYNPSGMTALFDAICLTVDRVGNELSELDENDRPNKVIFAVVTDGHENSSVEFSADDVRQRVDHQTKKYNWNFVFLGANINAFDEGTKLNFAHTIQWVPTFTGLRNLSEAVSTYTTSVRTENYDQSNNSST